MSEARRWDTDDRLTGVADAGPLAADLERLLTAASRTGWVAEDADAHLGVHLRRACEAPTSPWRWVGASQGDDGIYVVELQHASEHAIVAWRDAVALLSTVAESSFHVRRVDARTFECVTGMLAGDGDFAAHGHTIRIAVTPPDRPGPTELGDPPPVA